MTVTPHLGLPLIAASQAQKHVTHNEALVGIDALLQLAVIDRTHTVPPASPTEGDRYIVAAAPTGAWTGHAKHVALWRDGAWSFYVPRAGWIAFVVAESLLVSYDGVAWSSGLITVLQNLALLGLGTTADAANPFSAKLNKALWTARTSAEGGTGDLRYTMNKEGPANTLSILMQSAFSGRAEIGLTGDNNLHVKVSADGTTWTAALDIDRTSGLATFGTLATTGNASFGGFPSGKIGSASTPHTKVVRMPGYLAIGATTQNGEDDALVQLSNFNFISSNNWSGFLLFAVNLVVKSVGNADTFYTPLTHPSIGYTALRINATTRHLEFASASGATVAGAAVTPTWTVIA
jgi:hypothetical protein